MRNNEGVITNVVSFISLSNAPSKMSDATTARIIEGLLSDDEKREHFEILKELVSALRESLPLLTELHRRTVGNYMLAAYLLGRGHSEEELFEKKLEKPTLTVVRR